MKKCDFCGKPVWKNNEHVKFSDRIWHAKCFNIWKLQRRIMGARRVRT